MTAVVEGTTSPIDVLFRSHSSCCIALYEIPIPARVAHCVVSGYGLGETGYRLCCGVSG